MGKVYRHGKLLSADTWLMHAFRLIGTGAEEDLWPGTAVARPTPAGIQLRLISTSLEDDYAKAERQTITVAGTMNAAVAQSDTVTMTGTIQPATKDKWTCTLAGTIDTGDVLRLTLNGVNYDTAVAAGATMASLAAESATGAMSGTWDTYKFTYGGTIDVGDTARLTINGVNYDVVSTLGTGAEIANLMAAAAAGDALYDVVQIGATAAIKCTKKVRGVGSTVSSVFTVDAGVAATVTTSHVVTGVAGQSAWTCTDNGVSAVIAEHATAGVTADTVASSYPTDGGGASTYTAVHTTTGEAADVAAVVLNGVTYSHTVVTGNTLDTIATALAALLDALPTVAASAVGAVITVVASVAGTGGAYTLTNACTNNQVGGVALTATVASVAVGANADVLAVSDGTTTFSRTVTTGVLADECTALAALIDASASYAATALAGVITVVAPDGAAAFAFSNVSTDNQTADLTVTIATVIAAGSGTGIRTLRLEYIDSTGARAVESVNLNGLTAVLTAATDIGAIVAVTATSVGSAGGAVGVISITNVGNTVTYDGIAAGGSETIPGSYTVPLARTAYVLGVHGSASAASELRLRSDVNPATGAVVSNGSFVWALSHVGAVPGTYSPGSPIGPFPAGARIWVTGKGNGNTVVADIEGYLAFD